MGKVIEASGAKSIIKKAGQASNKKLAGNVSFGQCLVFEYNKDPL
jgi:hypothetical protein